MNTMYKKCNVCGHKLGESGMDDHLVIDLGRIGYGSIHDGERFNCTLCYRCFDKITSRIGFAIDPFMEEE